MAHPFLFNRWGVSNTPPCNANTLSFFIFFFLFVGRTYSTLNDSSFFDRLCPLAMYSLSSQLALLVPSLIIIYPFFSQGEPTVLSTISVSTDPARLPFYYLFLMAHPFLFKSLGGQQYSPLQRKHTFIFYLCFPLRRENLQYSRCQ